MRGAEGAALRDETECNINSLRKTQKGIICTHYLEVVVAGEHLSSSLYIIGSLKVQSTTAVEIGDVIEASSCVSDKKTKKQY